MFRENSCNSLVHWEKRQRHLQPLPGRHRLSKCDIATGLPPLEGLERPYQFLKHQRDLTFPRGGIPLSVDDWTTL